MQVFGLVGRHISYSFSRAYFADKFARLKIDAQYLNFDLEDLSRFDRVMATPGLRGFNVTIPYKVEIIPLLNSLSPEASRIGAVNTVKVDSDGSLRGHNTDWIGFTGSLRPLLKPFHKSALILGTGGASRAVAYGLDALGIGYQVVSRSGNGLKYGNLQRSRFPEPLIVINCTPVGTAPNMDASPLPAVFFRPGDIAFDLIYNPSKTQFLTDAESIGAVILNGLPMLEIQAEKSWEIWSEGNLP